MFWTIVLTALVSILLCIVFVLWLRLKEREREISYLRGRNKQIYEDLKACRAAEFERKLDDSYYQGLDTGRETDRAYRELLRRCSGGDIDSKAYRILQQEKASD